jgi:DNA-3-methyladenine glycosylase
MMDAGIRLMRDFYIADVLSVAPALPGKILAVKVSDTVIHRLRITEVEAYRGVEDMACHAFKGRTSRTEIMFHEGGRLYIYFIYGMYWLMNIVTGGENEPQAALIRGVENYPGPGRLTKALAIDKSYYGEDLVTSERIWVEDDGFRPEIKTSPRIGIEYSGDFWKTRPWRYFTA